MVEARTGELKESREKYRDISRFLNNILDSATVYAIMALDFRGNIIEFNKGAEKLFGWKKEEVINNREYQHYHSSRGPQESDSKRDVQTDED